MTRAWKPIVLLAWIVASGCSGPVGEPAPFDRNVWLAGEKVDFSSEAPRLRMADGLISSRVLLGKDRSEIAALLGPDSDTVKFRSYERQELVYWLGNERSYMPIDSEWLVVRFDTSGRVTEARIVRD
jgi:hypothetical protein